MKRFSVAAAFTVAAVVCLGVTLGSATAFPADHLLTIVPGEVGMAMSMMSMNFNNSARGLVGGARADASNAAAILAELQKTFETFKAEREEELKGIDRKFADVVQTEKVERINAEITNLQKALDDTNAVLAALKVGGQGDQTDPDVAEHNTAFNKWFRKGDRAIDADLRELEVKASLSTQSDPDGGYVVPEEMSNTIDRVVGAVSAMRGLAMSMNISTDTFKKLVNMGGAASGWVGETDSRPETATPTLRELVFNTAEIYANPAATQTLLDDSRVDIAQWLASEVSIEFAEKEGAAFINGDGVKKPRGILQYDTVENGSYSWGNVGFVVSGAAAGFAASDPADAIINLLYSLKQQYRNGATWLTSDAVMGTIRKFKDGDGNYLWAPPSGPEKVATILGKPVSTDDNMPALGANAFPLAFGNFQRAYLIIDRFGIRVLRDPYTNKPYVHFYTTKRVGGGVQNFEALKLLKCST